tara:strand:+ start:374 stop:607 length:234 start_codon:yes stop_codon:yes gene_type:complete
MATPEWVKFNQSAKAGRHREKHVAEHGGEFVKTPKNGWHWVAPVEAPVQEKPKPKKEKVAVESKTKKKSSRTKKWSD